MNTIFHLKRTWFNEKWSQGEIWLDGEFQCDTLELPAWFAVVKFHSPNPTPNGFDIHKVCVPQGQYEIIINFSERFQRPMPLLLNVPERAGIRIHSGNTDKDTEGCILVGKKTDNPDFIEQSRATFSILFPKIEAAIKTGKVYLNITDEEDKI